MCGYSMCAYADDAIDVCMRVCAVAACHIVSCVAVGNRAFPCAATS